MITLWFAYLLAFSFGGNQFAAEGNAPIKAARKVQPLAEAGATWWLETRWTMDASLSPAKVQEKIRRRIELGPPKAGQ